MFDVNSFFGPKRVKEHVDTTVKPLEYLPDVQQLLGPTSRFFGERIGTPQGFGNIQDIYGGQQEKVGSVLGSTTPTTVKPTATGLYDVGRFALGDVLMGRYDPSQNPAGYEAAYGAASAPLLRQWEQQILPGIQAEALRAGVPRGNRVDIASNQAGQNLMDTLQNLAGQIYGQRETMGADMLSRALGMVGGYEAMPYATGLEAAKLAGAQFAPSTAELDLLNKLVGTGTGISGLEYSQLAPLLQYLNITRPQAGSTSTRFPVYFPSEFESLMGAIGTGTQGIGSILSLVGAAGAMSSERFKKDISEPLSADDIIDAILDIPTRTWKYKWEGDEEPVHVGPIIEDLPPYFKRGDTFLDVGSVLGGTVLAVQALDDRLNELEEVA